jgi:hypothetical protein
MPDGQQRRLEDLQIEPPEPDLFSRVLLILGIALLVIAIVLTALVLTRHTKGDWDPLGPYPQQETGAAVYHSNQLVDVTAQKCAKTDRVMVSGVRAWTSTDQPGLSIVQDGGRSATRYKSCGPDAHTTHFHYKNVIPDAVVALVKNGAHEWRLTGTDTPYKEDGERGVPRTWTTNSFAILP